MLPEGIEANFKEQEPCLAAKSGRLERSKALLKGAETSFNQNKTLISRKCNVLLGNKLPININKAYFWEATLLLAGNKAGAKTG